MTDADVQRVVKGIRLNAPHVSEGSLGLFPKDALLLADAYDAAEARAKEANARATRMAEGNSHVASVRCEELERQLRELRRELAEVGEKHRLANIQLKNTERVATGAHFASGRNQLESEANEARTGRLAKELQEIGEHDCPACDKAEWARDALEADGESEESDG